MPTRIVSLLLLLALSLLPSLAAGQNYQAAVVSFSLINADKDQPIAGFDPLTNGATLNLALLPTRNLNIRANTSGTVASVRFGFDNNPNYRTDDVSPYSLAGDSGGDYFAWTPAIGNHTVIATPYRMTRARGPAGSPLSISFAVIDSQGPNQPPTVNAGADQAITLPTNTVTLTGTASDDGLPSGTLTVAWTVVSGPGAVTFGTPTATTTTATFASAGVYVLRLTASDGALSASDDVTVTVNPAAPTNQPPTVNAGADQAITLPTNTVTLTGTASDDGLPSGTLTVAWTVVSGPGAVTFGTPTATTTTATFASAGVYVLRLTASDGALSASDDVTVTVNATSTFSPIRINAGGGAYLDSLGRTWEADSYFVGPSSTYSTSQPISGTTDDALYQTERFGKIFGYQIPVPNGSYEVDLHFAEIYWTAAGRRVFDVSVEGALVLDDVDLWSVAGANAAFVTTVAASVMDGVLNIGFSTAVDNAKISAIEVRQRQVSTEIRIDAGGPGYTDPLGQVWLPDTNFVGGYTFSTTAPIAGTTDDPLHQTERYGNFSYQIPVQNGGYQVTLHFAEIYWTEPGQRVFDVLLEGSVVLDNFDVFQAAGAANTAVTRTFAVQVNDGVLNIDFVSIVDFAKVSAIEVGPHEDTGHPFLHVVINAPSYVVDYDGNGSQAVPLDGSGSHTHEPGRTIVSWMWQEGTTTLGSTPTINPVLGVGAHTITLTIGDDGTPPETFAGSVVVNVFPINAVGGVLTTYHPGGSIDAPGPVGYEEVRSALRVDAVGGMVGGSPYAGNVVVVMTGALQVTAAGNYAFQLVGGTAAQVYVDGTLVTGPRTLTAGPHGIEARFAVSTIAVLPAEVLVSVNGGPAGPVPSGSLEHDETNLPPFLNALTPSSGAEAGGEAVRIDGIGFFTKATGEVTVNWGGTILSGPALTINARGTAITLLTPPGTGTVSVSVQTPNGTSNSLPFTYVAGTAPVDFQITNIAGATPLAPTQAAWGPDGRLYVGSANGPITIYTFDDNYNVVGTQVVNTIAGLSNPTILGIAFNPFDSPSPVKVYVAHSQLFANGGACFTGPSPYSGEVSVLTGPNFDTAQPLITGLPVSNHDHGVNGLEFDNNGDLLIAVGATTNAGVAGDCEIGQLPESPFSAAILRAKLSKGASFNGTITYVGAPPPPSNNVDQMFGEVVSVAPGVDIEVLAAGLRNAFDLVLTTRGRLYATDNGPNFGFGPASTGPTTEGPDPQDGDELNLIGLGDYYGHPNRNRGREDVREYVYQGNSAPANPAAFTQGLAAFAPSTNGITEYRAQTFGGAMQGELLTQQWRGQTYRTTLSPDGRSVTSNVILTVALNGLDILTGPGGVLIGIDYSDNAVKIARPIVAAAAGLSVYDIFPWRAPASGGTPFVIGGSGFGTLADTAVTIGGLPATLTSVSATRIRGTVPANPSPTAQLLDVVVAVSAQQKTLPAAFRYLFAPGQETTGAQALVLINTPSGGLQGGSTFTTGSFQIVNQSTAGQKIERVRIDLRSAVLPDLVYDPNAVAGDVVGKPFTPDSGAAAVGLQGHLLMLPHDSGYDWIEIQFSDFTPGKTFTFSIDVDPTSIQGSAAPGPHESGSVSGLELTGSRVTVFFNDGTMHTGQTFRIPGSDVGSQVVLKGGLPVQPEIQILGVTPPDTVTAANQTVRVTGPVGSSVRLLLVEAGLFTAGVPGGGFDLDPFEANTVLALQEYTASIGAGGFVDIPVILTKSDPDGGLNHFVATLLDGASATGPLSETLVVKYTP